MTIYTSLFVIMNTHISVITLLVLLSASFSFLNLYFNYTKCSVSLKFFFSDFLTIGKATCQVSFVDVHHGGFEEARKWYV